MFKRKLAVTLVLGAALGLASCSSGKNNRAPGATEAAPGTAQEQQPGRNGNEPGTLPAQPVQPWKLTYKAECQESEVQDCAGNYGFSINHEGQYQVGPGPAGQIKEGQLAPEELKGVEALLSRGWPHADSAALTSESCRATPDIDSDTQDQHTVTLTQGSAERKILRTSAEGFCFQSANADDATKLHELIRQLVNRYYLLPFPDLCLDAKATLDWLHASVQGCNVDADCSYINANYSPVPPESEEFVLTDSCTLVQPLAVANANALVANSTKIIQALSETQESCGARLYRDDCLDVSGFFTNAAPPVCQQGACRINPSSLSVGAYQ